jgi:hypothetical protein
MRQENYAILKCLILFVKLGLCYRRPWSESADCIRTADEIQISIFFLFWCTSFLRSSMPQRSCARCAIAEVKERSQRSVIGWVTKFYYLEFLRASEVKPAEVAEVKLCPSSGDINRLFIYLFTANKVIFWSGIKNLIWYLVVCRISQFKCNIFIRKSQKCPTIKQKCCLNLKWRLIFLWFNNSNFLPSVGANNKWCTRVLLCFIQNKNLL